MNAQRIVEKVLSIGIILLILVAGFGQAVLQLWNWLMPRLFSLPVLSFWEAVGLMGLSWILFGGLRGLGFMNRPARGFERTWERMTPEERQRFRRGMQAVGGSDPTAG